MAFSDAAIFEAVNGLAGRWSALDAIGIFGAAPLIFLMAAGGMGRVAYLVRRHDPLAPAALTAAFRAAGASGMAFLGNLAFASYVWLRPRPYLELDVQRLVSDPLTPQSFPSGHASVAFAIAFTSLFLDPKCGRWLFAGAVLVAIGRIFVGVHYPLDVLAGAAVGLLWALIVRVVGRKLDDVGSVGRLLARDKVIV